MYKVSILFLLFMATLFADNFVSFSDPNYRSGDIFDTTALEKKLLEMKEREPNAMFVIDYRTGEIKEIVKEK